ncbi:Dipeptidase 1, partial [Orchesella cincta]
MTVFLTQIQAGISEDVSIIKNMEYSEFSKDPTFLSKLADINGDGKITAIDLANLVLSQHPLIDGHNDLPWTMRQLASNDLRKFDLSKDLTVVEPWASASTSHTDIPRLRKGKVGGVFWIAYVDCHTSEKDAVTQTIEQIDVINRFVKKYSDDFQFATTSEDIIDAISKGKIASLIGVEGGHSIQSSPGVLRILYQLGARYMTLTHSCNTPWSDASPVDHKIIPATANGLSEFGLKIVDEMNRLGMIVDVTHTSEKTSRDALKRSKAPVIFSHSQTKNICDHHRNVPDDILHMLKENGGIIMVNFCEGFLNCNKSRKATIKDVIDHLEYIRSVIGSDYIGIGADYNGVPEVAIGLEDTSKYPDLFAALIERGWTHEELAKLSNLNIIRVLQKVEQVLTHLSSKWEGYYTLALLYSLEHSTLVNCQCQAKFSFLLVFVFINLPKPEVEYVCVMKEVSRETKGKIFATVVIAMIAGISVLFGILLFELPWSSSVKAEPHTNQTEIKDQNITSLEKAFRILKEYPVVDGHNDFAYNMRKLLQNQLSKLNFSSNLKEVEPWASYNESYTDIPTLRQGHVGGVFWVVFTPCESQGKDSVIQTIEQIDLIHRLVDQNPNDLLLATNSEDLSTAKTQGKIASFIGIEGGHSISSSPAIVRMMYKLGVRYLTLTHQCNTPWADASLVDNKEDPLPSTNNGLSEFGEELIYEMNRIGMMVDLSHVSEEVMRTALKISKAPVIFSHSGAKSVCNHHRNVPDGILKLLQLNGGIIMVNFYPGFVNCNKSRTATLQDVADHLDHIRKLIGAKYVGLGTDYNGVPEMPQGLEDVSKFPYLFAELIDRGWNQTELSQLSFLNIQEVMQVKVELAADSSSRAMEKVLPATELKSKKRE